VPSELKAACAGKPDPALALQQVLGLPPDAAASKVVTEITVKRRDLFRPCAGGGDLATPTCSFDLARASGPTQAEVGPTPEAQASPTPQAQTNPPLEAQASPTPQAQTNPPPEAQAIPTPQAQDGPPCVFDVKQFVANQMWNVYRDGFPRTLKSASDYPFTGYPFTGMGWSYNWDPDSATHVGVSEFVVPRCAVIKFLRATTPAAFCAKAE